MFHLEKILIDSQENIYLEWYLRIEQVRKLQMDLTKEILNVKTKIKSNEIMLFNERIEMEQKWN